MTESFAIATTPVKILEKKGARGWVIIKNAGAGSVSIGVGPDSEDVTVDSGMVIASGAYLRLSTTSMDHMAREQMHAISASAATIYVTHG